MRKVAHDQFLENVINKVSIEAEKEKLRKLRKETENVTIEAIMEMTDLPQHEIKKLMEEVRDTEKRKEAEYKEKQQTIKNVKRVAPIVIIVLVFVIAVVSYFTSQAESIEATKKQTITLERHEQYQSLISAIRANEQTVVNHLLNVKKIPLYLAKVEGAPVLDPFYESALVSNRMMKTILSHGADPFYDMKSFELAADNAYANNNNVFFILVFNYLNKQASTPKPIKTLWENKIPYTSVAAMKAYKNKNFSALKQFNIANKGKYSHSWFKPILTAAISDNDVEGAKVLFDMLIKQETDKSKKAEILKFANNMADEKNMNELKGLFSEN